MIHTGCGFPPEASNLEQGPNIRNTPFRRARRSLPTSVAAGCRCPCPTWLWQCGPQPRRAILRQPAPAVLLLLLLRYPPDLTLRVPFGFIKAYLTQTVGKHFREKLSLSEIDNVFVPMQERADVSCFGGGLRRLHTGYLILSAGKTRKESNIACE